VTWTRALARLFVAHVVAYPLAFLWAVGGIPLTIHASARDFDALGDEAAASALIVRRLAWPAGAAFVLTHLLVIVWLTAGDDRRGQRRFLTAVAGLAALGLAGGGASWLWLLLR
jgi:hypothetical protein